MTRSHKSWAEVHAAEASAAQLSAESARLAHEAAWRNPKLQLREPEPRDLRALKLVLLQAAIRSLAACREQARELRHLQN